MDELPTARKSQYAALIRDESVLVVWADSVESLIPSAKALEQSLINLIWSGKKRTPLLGSTTSLHSPAGRSGIVPDALPVPDEVIDEEKAEVSVVRPVALISPIVSGLAFGLMVILMGLGISE